MAERRWWRGEAAHHAGEVQLDLRLPPRHEREEEQAVPPAWRLKEAYSAARTRREVKIEIGIEAMRSARGGVRSC